MRPAILFLTLLLCVSSLTAQKTDSIPYANGHLYFHEYGSGEPIVLLTGGPGANYQQLLHVAVTLGNNYRVILPEQRGSGRSMPKPFDASTINIDAAHADLRILLRHLQLKEAHFLGHSWGAMLAMSFASSDPEKVKSLLLVGPGPYKLDPVVFDIYTHNKEARLNPAERKFRDSVLNKMQSANATQQDSALYFRWELVPVIYDRTKVDSLVPVINKGGLNPATGSLLFQSLGKKGFDLSLPLSRFNKPVHIITGSQDPTAFVSYEIKILLPKATLHWIDEAGHFPMYEQPDRFYSTIRAILQKP